MTGLLLVDKPTDWTSHDVVAKLRGALRERRIGHAGTLDPMATGLLVLLVGAATRAASYAEAGEKHYTAHLRLGVTTDTYDITGTVVDSGGGTAGEAELLRALKSFRGEIEQLPPMYSAVKVDGRRLYELARRGKSVERTARRISIERLELVGCEPNGDFVLDILCSKGTYIRSLCHDIGQKLGTGGTMSALRRIGSGDFGIENALPLSELIGLAETGRATERLLPVETLFMRHPAVALASEDERKFQNGAPVLSGAPDGLCRIYGASGNFLALGETRDGTLRSVKRF